MTKFDEIHRGKEADDDVAKDDVENSLAQESTDHGSRDTTPIFDTGPNGLLQILDNPGMSRWIAVSVMQFVEDFA